MPTPFVGLGTGGEKRLDGGEAQTGGRDRMGNKTVFLRLREFFVRLGGTWTGSVMQGHVGVTVLRIRVGAGRQKCLEGLESFEAAPLGSDVQGTDAVRIPRVRIGAGRQECFDGINLAGFDGHMKRGAAIVVGRIRVDAVSSAAPRVPRDRRTWQPRAGYVGGCRPWQESWCCPGAPIGMLRFTVRCSCTSRCHLPRHAARLTRNRLRVYTDAQGGADWEVPARSMTGVTSVSAQAHAMSATPSSGELRARRQRERCRQGRRVGASRHLRVPRTDRRPVRSVGRAVGAGVMRRMEPNNSCKGRDSIQYSMQLHPHLLQNPS